MVVASKAQNFELFEAGKFGNKPRTWSTREALAESGYQGLCVLRYRGSTGGQWCAYGIPASDVDARVSQWVAEGADRNRIAYSEAINDDLITIQGEVQEGINGIDLRFSTAKLPMRKALADHQQHAKGLAALMWLDRYMDDSSRDDLRELMEIYPGAVIEFTTLSVDCGTVPRRNTYFWEVRHY